MMVNVVKMRGCRRRARLSGSVREGKMRVGAKCCGTENAAEKTGCN